DSIVTLGRRPPRLLDSPPSAARPRAGLTRHRATGPFVCAAAPSPPARQRPALAARGPAPRAPLWCVLGRRPGGDLAGLVLPGGRKVLLRRQPEPRARAPVPRLGRARRF